jgi:hypothetical protein
MASTYVNDLRLNEMATGDASGTWGTTTNTNLELIGEALGYGTEAITTNADTHTSTIADGATDPVRAMFVKYTGSLDSACTITIAPNTVNRMHFIENGTSGSQNIIIKQGSGATITIPPGDTKAVYLDGAGSGAAVVDAFASLSVVDLKVQDDLTVTDDATIGGTLGVTGIVTLTDDLIIGDGKTIGSASDVDAITIAANGQLTLTQTLIGTALDISGDIDVDGTSNLDVVDIDGAVDMASTLQVDGAITSSAGATITVADNSENLILKSTDADANVGPQLTLWRASGSPADDDFIGQISYNANDDGGNVTNFAKIFGRIRDASDGTEDAQLTLSSMVAGTLRNRLEFNEGEVVFNDDSVDVDFRVESDNLTHALFLQGSDGRVGIGTDSPDAILEVVDAGAAAPGTALKVYSNQNSAATDGLVFIHSEQSVAPFTALNVRQDGNGDILNLLDGTTEVFTVLNGGNVGIGTASPAAPLSVHGNVQFRTTNGDGNEERINWNVGGASDAPSQTMYGADGATAQVLLHAGGSSYFTGGNLGVGDNSPAYRLELPNTASSAGQGRANAWVTYSDSRIKSNIQTLSYGLDIVKQLKPSQYKHHNSIKEDGQFVKQEEGTNDIGFIAQEVLPLMPEVVSVPEDVDKDLYSISYPKLTAVLTKAIQEQQTIIEDLKTRIETLEGE